MKCKLCKTGDMIRVGMLGESFCNACTKCPNCGEVGANIDKRFGVMNCNKCQSRLGKLEDGEFTGDKKSFRSKEEYWATPFWKHMGLKPKKHEKRQETEMRRRGLSYLDLQRARNKNAKPNPQMRKVVDLALKGELVNHVKKVNDNRRKRVVGKQS